MKAMSPHVPLAEVIKPRSRKGVLVATGATTVAGGATGLVVARAHKKEQSAVGKYDERKHGAPSTGRKITAATLPGAHGAVAGVRGKKLKAAGREFGETALGSIPLIGAVEANVHATHANQAKGRYKPQKKVAKAYEMVTHPKDTPAELVQRSQHGQRIIQRHASRNVAGGALAGGAIGGLAGSAGGPEAAAGGAITGATVGIIGGAIRGNIRARKELERKGIVRKIPRHEDSVHKLAASPALKLTAREKRTAALGVGIVGTPFAAGGYAAGRVGRKKKESTVAQVRKADNAGPSSGRVATTALFPGPHGLIAGKKGKKLRAGGREYGEAFAGGVPGMVAARYARTPKAALGTSLASLAGSSAGGIHASHANQAKGRYKKEPASKAFMIPEKSTKVRVMVPTGKNVGHGLDLSVTRIRKPHQGPSHALETYHGKGPKASAVAMVSKGSGLGQSTVGLRGTPLSDISRQSRYGRRLDFNKADDYRSYFANGKGSPAPGPSRASTKAQYNRATSPGGHSKFFAGSAGSAMPKKPGRFARILRRAR